MSDILDDIPGDVSTYPTPLIGTPRLIKALRSVLQNPEHDELFQEVLNIGYTEWQRPEHEDWSFADMIDWMTENYGEEAALIVMLGKFNQQVCNGGIFQWLDNGYASDDRGRKGRGYGRTGSVDLTLLERMLEILESSSIARLPLVKKVAHMLILIQEEIESLGDECYTCHNHRYVKCEDCDGTGKMAVGDDEDGNTEFAEEECDVCGGEGEVPCGDCNEDGQLEIDAPEADLSNAYNFDRLEREFYSYNSNLEEEIEGYLKSLVRSSAGGGLLSRAQAFKATENLLKMLNRLIESLEDIEDEDFDPESDLQSDIDRTNAHKRGERYEDEDEEGEVSSFKEPLVPPEVLADEFEDKLHGDFDGGAYQVARHLANIYNIDIYDVINAVAEFGDESDIEDIMAGME